MKTTANIDEYSEKVTQLEKKKNAKDMSYDIN